MLSRVPAADILVNNTGIYGERPFFEIDDAEWERFFQTNVMSGVRLSRGYLKGMMAGDADTDAIRAQVDALAEGAHELISRPAV